MEREDIEQTFEAFFEKYKKTEGDRTAWSAFWSEMNNKGTLDLNMTKCPRGQIFKVFVDKKKVAEVEGWDAFHETMKKISEDHPDLYDQDKVFEDMKFTV